MASNYGVTREKLERAHLSARLLIELTTEDPSATEPDANVLDDVIAGTEAIFEGYAGVYYPLPVRLASDPAAAPPHIVSDLVTATSYMLMTRRPALLSDDVEGKFWREKWEEILGRWEKYGRAKDPTPIVGAALPVSPATSTAGRGAEAVSGSPAQFTRENLGSIH